MQALKPDVDLATAVALAREVWGLEVCASLPLAEGEAEKGEAGPRPLDSYDDNNFYIVCVSPSECIALHCIACTHSFIRPQQPSLANDNDNNHHPPHCMHARIHSSVPSTLSGQRQ